MCPFAGAAAQLCEPITITITNTTANNYDLCEADW